MVHSSCVVKSGQWSMYFRFLSHCQVNFLNRYTRSSNSNVEFHHLFTPIIGGTAICTLACWQSMESFQHPGVSIINTRSILCYIKVSFSTFKICWNTYFPNYLCQTWSHGRHFVDSSIAVFSKSLTFPNVYAFIISKLLIAHMGFPRLGVAFYTQTPLECTQSKLNDVRQAWYVASQCRPLDSWGLKGRL